MLELKNIIKEYPAGEDTVEALKGIDLRFRISEFVSILGPSGCGKTTLLNIVGGLDQYTSGDLVINGRSTKDFKDRDWDAYRNHSIGFVFQNYNLIPQQSVLQNVEIALTLAGISKAERRERAKKALDQVGLSSQLKKKPNQLSGGQMQRVAIARALVNDPDIILADEPTGALDTETSVQVMEILKEISKDRLIIMVTHNPDLADRYSTRIVRMLDGVITDDSMPVSDAELENEKRLIKQKEKTSVKEKKPSMSISTSFGLSLKNLVSKRKRTLLTSFAGSIGIIGIALVFAVSQGATAYINSIQEDTLSSYPITIETQNTDITTLMKTFMGAASKSDEGHDKDAVYEKSSTYEMIDALNSLESTKNDLKSFKEYLESERTKEDSELASAVTGIQYTYDTNMQVLTKNPDGEVIVSDAQSLLTELMREEMGVDMSGILDIRERTGMMGSSSMPSPVSMPLSDASTATWQEMLSGNNGETVNPILEKQYDVVYGEWPTQYNEIVLVLDENNEIDDMTLYALGLKSEDEMRSIVKAIKDGTKITSDSPSWSYKEICDMEFKTVLGADCYTLDDNLGLFTDMRLTSAGLNYLYSNGISLKVTGIIRPNEDSSSSMLSGSIGYTGKLTKYIIEQSKDSDTIKAQLDDATTDIFTSLPFKETTGDLNNAEKKAELLSYINTLNEKGKANLYVKIMGIPDEKTVDDAVSEMLSGTTREDMIASMQSAVAGQTGMSAEDIKGYVDSMSDEELTEMFTTMAEEQFKAQYAQQAQGQLGGMGSAQLNAAFDEAVKGFTDKQFALYYDEALTFSENSYEDNLKELGYVNIDTPSTVSIYASTFESKDIIEDSITGYNEGKDELSQIKYTDYVGIIMSSVTSILNTITYILMAFVGISLVVSSIMIGVVTLISVQERTREIGILRALGASKKNVSSLFNAETFIIGLTSGLMGVLITYLLSFPINYIIERLTGIATLKIFLPLQAAGIFVLISVVLTLFAGIIPSRSAAKKDPVVALRTE